MVQQPILSVKDLSVRFDTGEGLVQAASGVDLELFSGETHGLVGESGSGKSVTALAIVRLLSRSSASVPAGEVRYLHPDWGPVDLLALSDRKMQSIRGRHISMVFQEPMTSLNPVKRCGFQVAEGLRWHKNAGRREAKQKVLSLFDEMNLPEPDRIWRAWPHELSGGQKQRVMLAMAMACDPAILIADEPTTALDVTVQQGILNLIRELQLRHGLAVLFISHDLGVIRQIARRTSVMRNGKVVEHGLVDQVFSDPVHPYTKALVACRPPLHERPKRLAVVEDFIAGASLAGKKDAVGILQKTNREEPILAVQHLSSRFVTKRNLWGSPVRHYTAVDDVSFELFRGETLGLVGESGSGKTSLGRSILRLLTPASGQVLFNGQDLASMPRQALRRLRPKFQIVFQDPYASLTPGISIGNAMLEPMAVHGIFKSAGERKERVLELLELVGLKPEHFGRYPHEFSGGQRQRVAIARALAMEPELLICDEAVSALDVSVQAQVLNLLNDLKQSFGLTYLFISHDLSVVKYMSDRVIVMKEGKVVEIQEADALYEHPESEYTRKLIAAIPTL